MDKDNETTVATLKAIVAEFVNARGWEGYHSPKNLSMSIAIEAAELMEHFQWCSVDESKRLVEDPVRMKEIKAELADIASYIFSFCNLFGIDLSTALTEKMVRNVEKYPVRNVQNGVLPLGKNVHMT